jgi:hypothetical protein
MVVCIIGSVWTSYRAGLKMGATQVLMVLEDMEFITVDEEGNIESK